MKRFRTAVLILVFLLATGGALLAQVAPPESIPNWSVPATWSPSRAAGGIQTMVDVSDGIPFVAISPCRIADTRAGQGFSGQAGPPGLTSFNNRNFQITGTPATLPAPPNGCPANAVPAGADAVSVQLTIVFPTSAGNLVAWQQGATQPVVSVINWDAGAVALGSGTIIPLRGTGQLTVRLNTAAAAQGVQLVIDVNGYFGNVLNSGTNFQLTYARSSELMFVENTSTTCDTTDSLSACGLEVESNGLGSGIFALGGGSGITYGVVAYTASTAVNSAGVRAEGADVTCGDPGVRTAILGAGGDAGQEEVPVVGIGDYEGVRGINTLACSSTIGSFGSLGWTDDIAVFGSGGTITTGAPVIVDPHPGDASKMIASAALTGLESGTYFRGKGKFQNGVAVIEPPESFRLITAAEGLSIQVTPIGQMASVAVSSIGLDRIVVRGSRNVEFFYTVNGVRATFPGFEPIQENKAFAPQSKDWTLPASLSTEQRRRLIENGAYLENGKVNPETAKALGWDKKFQEPASTDGASQDKRGSRRASN
jgi:hypothetical protein